MGDITRTTKTHCHNIDREYFAGAFFLTECRGTQGSPERLIVLRSTPSSFWFGNRSLKNIKNDVPLDKYSMPAFGCPAVANRRKCPQVELPPLGEGVQRYHPQTSERHSFHSSRTRQEKRKSVQGGKLIRVTCLCQTPLRSSNRSCPPYLKIDMLFPLPYPRTILPNEALVGKNLRRSHLLCVGHRRTTFVPSGMMRVPCPQTNPEFHQPSYITFDMKQVTKVHLESRSKLDTVCRGNISTKPICVYTARLCPDSRRHVKYHHQRTLPQVGGIVRRPLSTTVLDLMSNEGA